MLKYGTEDSPFGGTRKVQLEGPLVCATDPWHPAVLTARDDDSVGEVLADSDGVVDGLYGYIGLLFGDASQPVEAHDLRVRYVTHALAMSSSVELRLSNVQMSHGYYGLWQQHFTRAYLRNALFLSFTNHAIREVYTTINVIEQGTFHRIHTLCYYTNQTTFLTNCLVVAVTNKAGWAGGPVGQSLSEAGVFQSAGAGGHYLAEGSPHRGAGTTNINPALKEALRSLTTHAPQLLEEEVSLPGVWGPVVPRGGAVPDLGYHYFPIDYLARGISLRETVVLTNGAVLAVDWAQEGPGLNLGGGAILVSEGTPGRPNYLLPADRVQEGFTGWSEGAALLGEVEGESPAPEVRLSFTTVALPSAGYLLNQEQGGLQGLVLNDCELITGRLHLAPALTNTVCAWTNTLFQRWASSFQPSNTFILQAWNNLFFEGTIELQNLPASSQWVFRDNLFDWTALSPTNAADLNADYNGYITGAARWTTNGVNDRLLSSTPTYLPGSLGLFYYPTNDGLLSTNLDGGSRLASSAGLYHFTVLTNDVAETNTTVDIGRHYAVWDTGLGAPADQDQDGRPDYQEDRNGNGSQESGETDWLTYESPLGIGPGPGLVVFRPAQP